MVCCKNNLFFDLTFYKKLISVFYCFKHSIVENIKRFIWRIGVLKIALRKNKVWLRKRLVAANKLKQKKFLF